MCEDGGKRPRSRAQAEHYGKESTRNVCITKERTRQNCNEHWTMVMVRSANVLGFGCRHPEDQMTRKLRQRVKMKQTFASF